MHYESTRGDKVANEVRSRKRDHSLQSGGRANHDKRAEYRSQGVESRMIPGVTNIGYDCKTKRLKALFVAYNSKGLGLVE